MDDDNDLFDNGDPWDHFVNMTVTLERLIKAHNNMVDDNTRLIKKVNHLQARMEEMRHIMIQKGFYDNTIPRAKRK